MGKWNAVKRAGGNASFGVMPAPLGALFSLGAPTAPAMDVNLVGAIPAPATEWSARSVRVSTGAVAGGTISAGTPISVPVAGTPVPYRIQVAWYSGTARLSEWATLGTITTI